MMALDGKLDYVVDAVFNCPTLAECYKVAALAALNRFSGNHACAGSLTDSLRFEASAALAHGGDLLRANLVNHPDFTRAAKRILILA
jgi:hypothetical protein